MQQGHPGAEALPEGLAHRIGQGNFGQEHQDAFSQGQRFLGSLQVHLGFAAGRHPVQQKRGKGLLLDGGIDGLAGPLLVRT